VFALKWLGRDGQLEGQSSKVVRLEMSCFPSREEFRFSLGIADADQGNPGGRITCRKSFDEALNEFVYFYFVAARGRFIFSPAGHLPGLFGVDGATALGHRTSS
jgi:hypothetical protein